jgi:hypothetical protein
MHNVVTLVVVWAGLYATPSLCRAVRRAMDRANQAVVPKTEAEKRQEKLRKGECPGCRYDVRGLVESQCPECGRPWHSTLLVQGVDGDREVVLDPALAVRLRLADHVRLPRKPVVLQAKLLPVTGGRRQPQAYQIFDGGQSVGWSSPWTMGPEHTFGPSREITVMVTQPGRQRLYLALTTRANGTERSQNLPPVPGLEITVGAEDHGKEFLIAPNGEPYERALRELDG